ncbi:nucleoside monophosphate kinase [Patescibacteria group bacterium]|nr:nucleoside monophosphate kinase [Patescibacteria group bacterium]MBU2633419.1 nucleoside monophosphate kinase [Patescibacteria group bacterium]
MNMGKPFNFILISRSGGGKGTQAEFIKKEFSNLYHFSTGDLFRDLQEQDTDTGYRIREILNKGGLPFDFLAITLWMHKIAYNLKRDQGLLADGFPRRLNEAKILDEFLDFLERKENMKVIYIDISEKEAFGRLTKRRICKKCKKLVPYVLPYKNWEKCEECGGELEQRSDDKPEAIQGRMDYFRERVLEILDYYREQGRLIEINGEQSIEDVWRDIKKAIEK